ncbi:MAG: 16S rRNA (adenine(1518)-N(6)/adenine(1519)-N(6))-dimethyltransferase RsmA [Pseudomonadota bacterium]
MSIKTHRPRKRFGQHFLHDPAVISRILANFAVRSDETLVEIGPGPGVLTDALANKAATLIALEIDRDLAGALQQRYQEQDHVSILNQDALKTDFTSLAKRYRLVGNLPYNISTPLLFRLGSARANIIDAHFMLQKEVVDRMAAAPGSKTYGRLSVMIQSQWQVDALFDIGPGAFKPPPKVVSAMVRLSPIDDPNEIVGEPLFHDVVKTAFAMRRKTLRNTLSGLAEPDDIIACGIDPGARAETLSVQDFVQLSLQIASKR